MFDISKLKDVQDNPLLAAEFIKIVPAYDLAKFLLDSYSKWTSHGAVDSSDL